MKTFLLSWFMAFAIFFGNVDNAVAQFENITNHTPPPCEYSGPAFRGAWIGPKTEQLCVPTGSGSCCYTIVYYDRMWKGQSYFEDSCNIRNYFEYDINITGIFYNDENCANYNKDSIVSKFQNQRYMINSQRQGFKDSVTQCCYAQEVNFWTWITATCKDANGEDCSYEPNRCCKTERKAAYIRDENGNCIYKGLTSNINKDTQGPPCPLGCIAHCNGLYMAHLNTLLCDKPCNFEPWSIHQVSNIPFDPNCPNCVITINYKYRKTLNCNPNYYDFELVNVMFEEANCSPCMPAGYNTVFPFAYRAMLMDRDLTSELVNGGCLENIRFTKALCYGLSVNLNGLDTLQGCGDSYLAYNCCITKLKICKNQQGNLLPFQVIESYTPNNDTCATITRPCHTFCFDSTSFVVNNDDKFNEFKNIKNLQQILIKPNPTNEVLTFELKNYPKQNYKIEIVNSMGILVKSYDYENQLYSNFEANISDINLGIYNIIIIDNNNNKIYHNKFIKE